MTPTPPNARARPTPWSSGTRSPRSRTRSGPAATTRLDLAEKAFGGRVVITLADGTRHHDEIAVADAHPLGARPFAREDYVAKFRTLADGLIAGDGAGPLPRRRRAAADSLADDLIGLTFTVDPASMGDTRSSGIFDWRKESRGRNG